jgi:exonuclease SbcC
MIPVRLALKNFMCYRDNVPTLSFEGIHIACLCGDNGNGKSALFDAMTWALWGRSRAKSDDDLIHLGQSEMEVELEFNADEQRYRVLRKHTKKPSKGRVGQTVLELQISDNTAFKSVSGNSLQETQQKIAEILNLDYETFKNSAFLRQGHADEFSVKRPGDRKEVLANILGLSHYDRLETRAKEQSTKRRAEADRLVHAITEIELQLIDRAKYEDEIRKIQDDICHLENSMKSEEESIASLRSRKTSLDIKKEQLSNIETHLRETKKELERLQIKTRGQQARISEYEKILGKKPDIEKSYSELTAVRKLNEEFNGKLRQLLSLRERMSNLDESIKKAAQSLLIEHKIVQTKFAEDESRFARVAELEGSLTQARKQVLELSQLEDTVGQKQNQVQQITFTISHLESANTQLVKELENINEKLRLLAGDDVHCPLCETELGADGRHQIEVKLHSEAQQKTKTEEENVKELNESRVKLLALKTELTQQESELNRERTTRHSRLSGIEKELAQVRQVGEQLSLGKNKLQELEQRLAKKDYALHEQQLLTDLEDEEQKLDYNKERHEQIQKKLEELERYEILYRELDEATKNLDKEKSVLAEAQETISSFEKTLKADLKKQEELRNELLSLPGVIDALSKCEEALRVSIHKERQVRDNLVALQERLRQLDTLATKKKEKSGLLQDALNEESIYKELAEAFSKKGIQALLIEQALPEIEMEANRLLAKMTDNRMSLRLESQRETKKGDTVETLDIKIADELGTRNYEMYSGGEAFRIDLALRTALSMLLVRRAGASLPILIIDEGFGTQDAPAREKLVEAINSIQNDFEKIIVITHLEEMKEKFQTLINVTKTASGSIISIS